MAEIDLRKVTYEMIPNGTWRYDGVFWQALDYGVVGFDGENFYFPESLSLRERKDARKRISFILGLEIDLDEFYSQIAGSKFAFLSEEFRGLTVPASPYKYQALVEAVAQQQVSFEFAKRTIAELVKLGGRKVGDLYLFPKPSDIGELTLEELKKAKLGYRAEYIKHLTGLIIRGELKLDLEGIDEEEGIRYLTKFRGIGKWTAELFLTYGLRKNVYPAGDLGLRRGIAKIFNLRPKEVRERDVREILEPYGKWKSLLAFYVICYDRKTEMEKRKKKRG